MKRGHTEKDTRNLLGHIRTILPGAAIRSTLITGYPGETENDFNKLLDFVREFRFDRLGVFTYSHEEDTRAHSMFTDNIPGRIKRERADRLMELQQEISLGKNLDMVGKEMRVLIDRKEGTQLVARSENDSPEVDQEIFISSEGAVETGAGDFCKVRITSAGDFELQAEII
jgi:ribosomal protein S12 methylthiotransferase